MSVLERLAHLQGRRDDAPNQELAGELAEANDADGIREIAENLFSRDKDIQSDCIKVLYETGYIKPELIAGYAGGFLRLLKSSNNRLVWGAMLALSTIAEIRADEICKNLETILEIMKNDSVIAVDSAVKTLAGAASRNDEYREKSSRIFWTTWADAGRRKSASMLKAYSRQLAQRTGRPLYGC